MNFNTQTIGKLLLRFGFVFVFAWFGISQLLHPDMWTSLIPGWVTAFSGMSAHTVVLINGGIEVILALALAFNLYVWFVAGLLALHLLSIAVDLRFNAVAIRDIGLAISVLALAFLSWNGKESQLK